jgi:hypothetical protein
MTSLTNLVRYALLSTAAVALAGCGGGGGAGDQTSSISPASNSINAVPALQADTAAASNAPAGSQSNVASNIVTLPGPRANYTWTVSSTGVVVKNLSAGATSTLSTSVARLTFSDGATAFDISGVAGQAYRLYQAALDRAPDQGGLGYQIAAIEGSGLSLTQVSQNFIASAEFANKYGNVSNSQFITQLYQNVLHRAPDAAGLQYYLAAINSGQASKAQIIINFSESPENMANVLPSIQNGMGYVPYPTLAASQGFPASALQIATQPQSVNVPLNGNTTLGVVARGNSALPYQWYIRDTALFGATGAAYTVSAAAASDAADNHVVVTNASGNSLASNSAAVGLVGLASDTSGSMASGRVMVGTINGRAAKLPPANTSWQLAYKYRVPPLPGGSWNPNQQTFYIWGDVDFDPYGPQSPQWSISGYKYNQIVPQLFIGNVLSQNDPR